ncbi:MAG: UxaA family hydrolase [bacterium]|nr:UxaA family hydrolase [bacterium]
MPNPLPLSEIGRLPLPEDNVAIATRNLDPGTVIQHNNNQFVLDHTILEGHRFAVKPIPAGQPLLSWHLPFGIATTHIAPGTYVCNTGMLEALNLRNLPFALPKIPNFRDSIQPYTLDENTFRPGTQVAPVPNQGTFKGYCRASSRGVGTRNTIVILGTTSRTGSYARRLEERLKGLVEPYPNIDGIVAVAHTEGGGQTRPNNLDLLLRTLAGFIVHPNVGAVLVVDYGTEPVTNALLRDFMEQSGYPLSDVRHEFLTLQGGFEENLTQGETIVNTWMDQVNQDIRTDEPLSHLKIALQCGGSDAFSGISGNPLVSWVARETIRHGGTANLAETDELIGAESYILQNAKDLDTARRFLHFVESYKELAAWHGTSAEGNPSGGNKYRGLYNIVLKSIGAAMNRHPDVRLDNAIAYSEPMTEPGYYFMDSPGNDLESIAGQVASGCNMIFFVTGNGSITNFPFVPTLKVITTSKRYELLSNEMDVNAGDYLDGISMDELGQQMTDLTVETASGALTKGERAGHAQVSIWRDWQQTGTQNLEHLSKWDIPDGTPVPILPMESSVSPTFQALHTQAGPSTDRIGLILPTSLCSGQIAQMAAHHLTEKGLGKDKGLSRFVALVHTEGCGMASGSISEQLYARTLLGYLTHPLVQHGFLLEHGCEKTHNDYMKHELHALGLSPDQFGWGSVQLDGGIENSLDKIEAWFASRLSEDTPPALEPAGLNALRIGLLSTGPVNPHAARTLSSLARRLAGHGATLVIPDSDSLLENDIFRTQTFVEAPATPTLAYGQPARRPGFHVMETQTGHWVEILTGLGGTGVEFFLAYTGEHPMQGHPMLPMLQMTAEARVAAAFGSDLDLVLPDGPGGETALLKAVLATASRTLIPKASQQGNTDFQVTRGLLGISM